MTIRNDATRLRIPQRDARPLRAVVARQGQVLLDTDVNMQAELLLARIEHEARDSLGAPGRLVVPAGTSAFAITLDGALANVTIGAGDAYLDGTRLENVAPRKLMTQPHPFNGAVADPSIMVLKTLARHIDPVEDNGLADVALGDAQASGRSIDDWRVFPLGPQNSALNCSNAASDFTFIAMAAPSSGRLAFIPKIAAASTDPCSLTPGGGYSRYENLLYRVEVHGGVAAVQTADGPRFGLDGLKLKLSRRNASQMVRIAAINANRLTVTPPALDPRNWFAPGSYAEIVSIHDDLDLSNAGAERLFAIARADDDSVTLVEAGGATIAATGAAANGEWFLRLWDGMPAGAAGAMVGVATVAAPAAASDSAIIEIGDGLSLQLTGGAAARFRRGDFWTCAMRADGSIAWASGALAVIAERPHGPNPRYVPLAIVRASGIEDCRIPMATLTDRSLLYHGGDGQSVPPGTAAGLVGLPAKLRVAVMRGQTPVAGARIRWDFVGPAGNSGALIAGATTHSSGFEQVTDANGLAEVGWSIDPAAPDAAHQVQASLVGSPLPATPPIVFSSRFHTPAEHAGCSTFVIEQGSDWVTTLTTIDYDEDVAICFQRGEYSTTLPVELSGIGNVKISGAGDGSRIVGRKGECAIAFDGFASVTLSHLRVETLDTPMLPTPPKGDVWANEKLKNRKQHRKGSITIRNSAIVDISDMTLRCGGDIETGRTCLTIAGDPERPTRLVRVLRNRMLTGFLQDGMLVTDCVRSVIAQNELIAVRRSEKLGDNRVIHSKAWIKAVAAALASHFREADDDRSFVPDDKRFLKFGKIEASFLSALPQGEWEAMLVANPLVGDATPAAVAAHVEAMARKAASSADTGTKSLRRFAAAGARRGANLGATEKQDIVLSALLPVGVEVAAARIRADRGRRGAGASNGPVQIDGDRLVYDKVGLTFDTPLSWLDWRALFADEQVFEPRQPDDFEEFAAQVVAVAYRMASDAKLRARHKAVAAWFDRAALPAPAAARQAITCGGSVLGDVTIEGNRAEGFGQGAHVGTSHIDDATRSARNVRISDNAFYLRPTSQVENLASGIFAGNVDTLRIERNLVAAADDAGDVRHAFGIKVYGHLGHFVMIAQNRIETARVGIMVRSVHPVSPKLEGDYLWLAADNLVQGVSASNGVRGDSPLRKRDNIPPP